MTKLCCVEPDNPAVLMLSKMLELLTMHGDGVSVTWTKKKRLLELE